MQSLDLLFARVDDIDKTQHRIQLTQELGAKAMEQVIQDQTLLAKQLEATGQAVAKLTLEGFANERSDGFSEDSHDSQVPPHRRHDSRPHRPPPHRDGRHQHRANHEPNEAHGEVHQWEPRYSAPKLTFPSFEGVDPKIWRDKCEDFFRIMDLPESMWVNTASMHMNGNATKWARVLRCKGELGNWEQFMQAVEDKLGLMIIYKHFNSYLS